MIKFILSIFMLVTLLTRTSFAEQPVSEESFMHISAGISTPFEGFLFKPEALAKIYAETEQKEKTKQLEFDTKLRELNIEIEKLKEFHKIEIQNRTILLEKITNEKNATIIDLNSRMTHTQSVIIGTFFVGALLGGFVVYKLL